jgi:hypothetical protein
MEKNTKVISTIIKGFEFEDDKLILNTEKGKFNCPIIKGTIQCSIETIDRKIVPLSYLDNGDIIKIKLKNNLISKIYVNTKFEMLLESSDEDYIS